MLADAGQIEMVLLNLLKNARQSFDESPTGVERKVTIAVGQGPKNRPFVTVSDTGIGIEAELLEEIFIPFFTTKKDGTGIGLSISRQIMQQHGGDLAVRSVAGQGAEFSLLF